MRTQKNTGDLQQELMSAADLDKFIKKNENNFINRKMADVFNDMYAKRDMTKALLAKRAGISEVYLHQVFAGNRNPSRNRVICLCVGMEATFDETQEVLKQCEYVPLSPKKKRDAVVIYGLLHGMTLNEINDKLFSEGEETLC